MNPHATDPQSRLSALAQEARATFDQLRATNLAAFGILTGHIWIWEAAHLASASFPTHASGVWLYGALSLFALVVAGIALTRRLDERLARRLDWPLAVVMAVGTALMCLPIPVLNPGVQVIVGGMLAGVGMAWSYLQWAHFYGRLDTRTIILCVFGAMLIGSAIKFPLDLLGTVGGTLACIALCLAAPALLRVAERRMPASTEPSPWEHPDALDAQATPIPNDTATPTSTSKSHIASSSAPDGPTTESASPDSPSARQVANPATPYASLRDLRPLLRTLFGVAAYGLVIGIMQSMRVEAAYTPQWLLSLVHHGAEILCAAVVLWYVLGSTRRSLHFSGMWNAVLLFTGAGVMVLPLVGPALSGWALVAVAVAQTLVVMLLWAMLADVAHHCALSPLVIFGGGWTAYCLSFPIGQLVGSLLNATGMGVEVNGLIVYLLALATVFLLSERDFSRRRAFADLDEPPLPTSMDASVRAACTAIGGEHELTEREAEVMYLICMGRSKGYIAETLSISENTVRSHSRHLYAKLDIHSKQDLLDLVLAQAGQ